MKRARKFFINGILLGCTTVFLRGASLAFNVYITHVIGAEGVGLFGLIMSVYTLATTVASSGAYLATVRLVTEEGAMYCDGGVRKAMRVCLSYTAFFGVSAALLLLFFARPIGLYWLCDSRTVRCLYLLSVSLPFVAMSSAMSGYFVAVRRVIKSASAQIFEMLIKMTVTFLGLSVFAGRGIEYACMAVIGGGSIAEICSFLYLYCLYQSEKKKRNNGREKEKRYTKRLLGVALPIAVSSYLRSGLVTLEHLLVPVGLKKFGASASASLAQYGVVHGMVMPLLLFPAAVLGAFSGLLVPELTEFQKVGNKTGIRRIATRALTTTFLFSIGAAGIFFVFADELGQAVYHSGDAGLFIRFLAPLVVVMYADGVVDAMLKGLNRQVDSMGFNIIDSAVSVALIYTLLPRAGVDGYVVVIFITELLNAYLSLRCLMKTTDFGLSLCKDVFRPAFLILSSAYGVRWSMEHFLTQSLANGWVLTLCLLLTGAVYAGMLFLAAKTEQATHPAGRCAIPFLKWKKPAVPPLRYGRNSETRPRCE
ncbi:MAG: polysaccharide biosynthesis C-terminal domain-containing protein [Clostridia bacterium]|nr:polysaccharide biosynthesis C-terminal domain-containing protein [Clostridia bacterium]